MAAPLVLRSYQQEAVQAHFDYFAAHRDPSENPIIVVPTGGGKSLIIAELLKRSLVTWPKTRFIVLTHVRELIRQNHDEFVGHWGAGLLGQCPAGIYSAGMGRRDVACSVLFAGIQSVYAIADELGPFDVVLIDECHLVPKKGQGRYLTYLAGVRRLNPRVRVVGYTATHFRLDGGYLHRGKDRMFTDVAYEVRIETLLEQGHLSPLVAKKTATEIDLSAVHVASTGDYAADELETAAMAEGCVESAVAEIVTYGRREGRRSWLLFASGRDHAQKIADELDQVHGVRAGIVFGDTSKEDRDQITSAFKSGSLPAIVNVGVLTTGFNAPRVDLLAILRATNSAALYVQIMGRGMRNFPGKRDCLVLDYGGNIARHGPINAVRPRKTGDGEKGPPPTKVCPQCQTILALGVSPCPQCGFAWTAETVAAEHERLASHLSPIDLDANRPRIVGVDRWFLSRHEPMTGENRRPTLRVDLQCGMQTISEWVCFEHSGFPRDKAARWWLDHGGGFPVPQTIDEAIDRNGEIEVPESVEVVRVGDYHRVARSFLRRSHGQNGEQRRKDDDAEAPRV